MKYFIAVTYSDQRVDQKFDQGLAEIALLPLIRPHKVIINNDD